MTRTRVFGRKNSILDVAGLGACMDDNGNLNNTQIPQKSAQKGGLMVRSIEILHSLQLKKNTETNQGSIEEMNFVENIESGVSAEENCKKQDGGASIVMKNGVYTIRKNLETSTVKMDPALKALVDSVCHY